MQTAFTEFFRYRLQLQPPGLYLYLPCWPWHGALYPVRDQPLAWRNAYWAAPGKRCVKMKLPVAQLGINPTAISLHAFIRHRRDHLPAYGWLASSPRATRL